MHGESARTLEPFLIGGAPKKFQECVAVAAGAMTKIRSFAERTRGPHGLAARNQQIVECRRRKVAEANDEPWSAMAELHEQRGRPTLRFEEPSAPIGERPLACDAAPDRIGNALFP